MLIQQEQIRIYEFSHDVGEAEWEIETPTFLLSVSYPDASSEMRETISGDTLRMIDVTPGISVEHHFFPYSVSTKISFLSNSSPLSIGLDFSSSVSYEYRLDGVVVFSDSSGYDLISIVPSRPTDDTEMSGPFPLISISEDGNKRILSVSMDEEWSEDTSRVYPITMNIDYLMTASDSSLNAIRMMSLKDQNALYHDTRPDSSTQFLTGVFDDALFTRPRPQFEGKPACSTVPTVLPNTPIIVAASQNLTISQDDADRYESGNGYDQRTVWLRFIASKEISQGTNVYYDINTPGTEDFNGNIAERIGDMDGLPIYRGSFEVSRARPPSNQDGIGQIHVYIQERRLNDLSMRMSVRGTRSSNITTNATVLLGHSYLDLLPSSIQVISYPMLTARCNVIGNSGVYGLEAKMHVNQILPAGSLITDPNFSLSSLFSSLWTTPITHAASGFTDAYDSGEMLWVGDGNVRSDDYSLLQHGILFSSPIQSVAIPSEMNWTTLPIFDSRMATGINITMVNDAHRQTAPVDKEWVNGTESSSIPILNMVVSGLGSGAGQLVLSIGSATTPWTGHTDPLLGNVYTYHITAASLAADDETTINISSLNFVSGYSYALLRLKAYPFTVEDHLSRQQIWNLKRLSIDVARA